MDPKEIRENTVRDAKEHLILDAARKVFADKGFHESRLEDIAVAAGFSKAALYNYYADKEAIFLNLAIRDFDFMITEVTRQIIPEAPIRENLERMVFASLRFFGEHFAFFLALSNFPAEQQHHIECKPLSKPHGELSAQFHKKFSQILDQFASVIKTGRDRGEVGSEIREETLASYITSLVRSTIFFWTIQKKMGDVAAEARQIADFACCGLNGKHEPAAVLVADDMR